MRARFKLACGHWTPVQDDAGIRWVMSIGDDPVHCERCAVGGKVVERRRLSDQARLPKEPVRLRRRKP